MFVRTVSRLLLGAAALLLASAMPALAADRYVDTTRGTIPMNSYGECWQTEYGVPPTAQCGGMKDSDGDGVYDDKDKCPGTPKGTAVDASGCPLDSDGDGVPDVSDRCPDTPHGVKVDAAGCPLDSDHDGVADYLDKCPDTPAGAEVDRDGCMYRIVLHNVLFATDSTRLTPTSESVLDRLAKALKGRPDVKRITVTGHTDSVGSAAYNQRLSERRAEAVVDYLAQQGIDRGMLQAVGKGEAEPVASNATAEGRAQNRRVQFDISK